MTFTEALVRFADFIVENPRAFSCGNAWQCYRYIGAHNDGCDGETAVFRVTDADGVRIGEFEVENEAAAIVEAVKASPDGVDADSWEAVDVTGEDYPFVAYFTMSGCLDIMCFARGETAEAALAESIALATCDRAPATVEDVRRCAAYIVSAHNAARMRASEDELASPFGDSNEE